MNEVKTFNFNNMGVRMIMIDNMPYFVGKDVASILGYKNTKDALASHVEEEDKRIIQRSDIATFENHIPKKALPVNFVSAEIPNRGITAINESGLYSLILSSKLPQAREFKHWVTSEVLPSIRKTGSYEKEGYKKKATSLGEVARFTQTMVSVMNKQGSQPYEVAEAFKSVCEQFDISLPGNFVKQPKVKQYALALVEVA